MNKNYIRRITTTILALCALCINTYANDGEFHVNGNHLIPISNTDIKIAKEILTIYVSDTSRHTSVDVDYTFINTSSKPKKVRMGFEASMLEDSDAILPKEGHQGHPCIYDFVVEMNGKQIKYTNEYAFIIDSTTTDYKHFPVDKTKWENTSKEYRDEHGWWDEGLWNKKTNEYRPYAYVYYFEATFLPGENKIHHTYKYDCGYDLENRYLITYWLTPAMRWNNKKIEDFTLRISAENTTEHFSLFGPFGKGTFNIVKGNGKFRNNGDGKEIVMRNGMLEYHCADFVPEHDLSIVSQDKFFYEDLHQIKDSEVGENEYASSKVSVDDICKFGYYNIWYAISDSYGENLAKTILTLSDWEKRVLRNLPYARRGYVFKDKKLADYFSQFYWYMPDPSWTPSQADFTEWERDFVKSFSQK